jgi:ADP-ribose pyrophosphatase YjhB (NUDIX family)
MVPAGDTHERSVCARCGFVNYQNPRIVVGSVVRHRGSYLLCRRAIEPRRGYWTIPAGYLEMHETPQDGARREAREEANAELEFHGLLAVYTVPRLSQVQLIYRATLAGDRHSPGEESLETGLFAFADIPWKELAFPTVHWALRHDVLAAKGEGTPPFGNIGGESTDVLP